MLLGYLVNRDAIERTNVYCMIVAFMGVLVIAFSKPMEQPDGQGDKYWVGIICSLTVSSAYAVVSVLGRKMQSVHFAVILFYYAILSVFVLWAILYGEALYKGERMRIFTMSWTQMGVLMFTSSFNTCALVF